ncbi:M23 family metallopeptidase [Paenarthrobacter sp. NPDC090517]|uniref:M23 family metallopeptidase n=1 Tax=Paenarthrobacter sp. NPDC090517 TaxID=3364381 RepID=UPI0038218AF1
MNKSSVGVIAAVTIFVLPIFILLGIPVFLGGSPASASDCKAPAASVGGAMVPGSVGAFSGVQLENAAAIMKAAKALGLPSAAQLLGVQAAIGESTLKVIDYGDGAGPDSRGLFQQRDNGAWGSYTDRMDPTISATNFFKALQRVEGWEALEPSLAIHRVQRNDYPNHYTQFRGAATEIVKALGGEAAAGIDASGACPAPGGSVVGELAGKWVAPMEGATMSSGYGPRPAPPGTAGGVLANFHYGIDFVHPGGPGTIVAVTDMKIVKVRNLDGLFGTGVTGQTMDGKLTIGMYHMEAGSVKVKEGDVVSAGTPLGTEGATGNVTGRHLHMEFFAGALPNPMVPINPTTDPGPILKEKGVL